jgi:hypothetical protein
MRTALRNTVISGSDPAPIEKKKISIKEQARLARLQRIADATLTVLAHEGGAVSDTSDGGPRSGIARGIRFELLRHSR